MRAIMGVSEACYLPAALALITDYHRGPTRSFATGLHMTGVMLGVRARLPRRLARRAALVGLRLYGPRSVGHRLRRRAVFFLRAPRRSRQRSGGAAGAPGRRFFLPAMVSLFSDLRFLLVLAYWGFSRIRWLGGDRLDARLLAGAFPPGAGRRRFLRHRLRQRRGAARALIGGFWADRWAGPTGGRDLRSGHRAVIAAPAFLVAANPASCSSRSSGGALRAGPAFADANMMPILCMIARSAVSRDRNGVLNASAAASAASPSTRAAPCATRRSTWALPHACGRQRLRFASCSCCW